MIASTLTDKVSLGLVAHDPDHMGAKMPGPLAEDGAYSPGGGMDNDPVPGLGPVGAAKKVLGRHALDHGRRGDPVLNGIG